MSDAFVWLLVGLAFVLGAFTTLFVVSLLDAGDRYDLDRAWDDLAREDRKRCSR